MCNKHYTTSVKTRFTFVFYTDSYIIGINHIFFRLFCNFRLRFHWPSH